MQFGNYDDLKRCTQIPFILDICAFVENTDCTGLLPGEIAIKGKDLFVRIGEYITEPQANKRFEAHRVYADVQYIVHGVEVIGVSHEKPLIPLTAYDASNDIQFFQTPKQVKNLVVSPKEFVLLLPGEAHQPGCVHQTPARIKKLVFKVKMGNAS
jgi:YhcH/YjgK/YiaL family protein